MCAIAGFIGLRSSEEILKHMETTMARRGPDSKGRFMKDDCVLLHSRLAIVDPEGGAQPMTLCCAGECYTLVYNGELYNTDEVKRELISLGHSFQTHSDTEVVLHAYAQWKWQCLTRFNGIFGFAVWEHMARKLFIARDRMGVKPLFFVKKSKSLIFASEIKTILAHPEITPCLDAEGAAQLLLLGPGRRPGSGVFQGVEELEPGWCGYYTDNNLNTFQYWKLKDRIHTDSFEETAQQVEYLVIDAIRKQMVSDVPLGTFLSGGLDSSLISSVCAGQLSEPLNTFSVDYTNNDRYFVPGKFQPESDNAYIEKMVKYLGSCQHWTTLDAKELDESLEEAVWARDLPGMADVDVSLLAFCKRIRGSVKMALSGECADEIFGGYPWFRDPEIRDQDGFPWAQNTALRASFLAPGLRQQIDAVDYVRNQYQRTIDECDILPEVSPTERRMKQMSNLNMRWFMQTLLDRKDRMSMYSGLEVRVPFCDYRIAEYMYSVPWEYKDYQGREKGLLRYAMRKYLPNEVLYRKKSPYPKTMDPAYTERIQKRLALLLEDHNAPLFQIADREAVRSLLNSSYTWPWYGQLMKGPQTMAYMLQMDAWFRKYQVQLRGNF